MNNHKQITIRDDLHLRLKRYCCDHSITMVDAVTDLVFEFLINKNYITDPNKAINGGANNA
jgi:hypothetical protein